MLSFRLEFSCFSKLYLAESWGWLSPTGLLDSPEWLGTAGCWCRFLCPYLLEKVSCLPAATHTAGRRETVRKTKIPIPSKNLRVSVHISFGTALIFIFTLLMNVQYCQVFSHFIWPNMAYVNACHQKTESGMITSSQ